MEKKVSEADKVRQSYARALLDPATPEVERGLAAWELSTMREKVAVLGRTAWWALWRLAVVATIVKVWWPR